MTDGDPTATHEYDRFQHNGLRRPMQCVLVREGQIKDDLGTICCHTPECPDAGKRGHENLKCDLPVRPGKSRRMLRCETCEAWFSERKGTALFDSRHPSECVVTILTHVAERNETRQTAWLSGAHQSQVR